MCSIIIFILPWREIVIVHYLYGDEFRIKKKVIQVWCIDKWSNITY